MLTKFSDDIAEIYENTILVNEVSQKFVDEVKDAVADRELPFQDIFGNAVRIVIPFDTVTSDSVISDILAEISKIKDYAGVDMKKGEVTRKIKIDQKYGGGEKEQKIAIGRAVASLKIDEDKKKKFLDFLARYRETLAEPKEYSIVISRNPIDILRMGEVGVGGMETCHAQGGSYFKCAIQEAKSGGGIAYVVKTEDIEKLSQEELQYDEIFADDKRDMGGIYAKSRLRIRRYDTMNKDGDIEASLAVPTYKIYGQHIPGFYQTVANFLKTKSKILNDIPYIIEKYKSGRIMRYGGSYTDISNDTAFNDMFPSDFIFLDGLIEREKVIEQEPEYDDEDDAEQIMNDELEHIENEYSIDHGNYGYAVYDDGDGPYYTSHASITFTDIKFREGMPSYEIPTGEVKRYNPDGATGWQRKIPYGFNAENILIIQNFLRKLETYFPSGVDLDDIGKIILDTSDDSITFELDTDNVSGFETSDYDYILSRLSRIDDEYEEIKNVLEISLGRYGFLEAEKDDQYTEIEKLSDFSETLQHSTFDEYDSELIFKVKLGKFDNNYVYSVSSQFGKMLINYLKTYFKPSTAKGSSEQLSFDKFFEAYTNPELYNLYNIQKVDTTIIDRYHPLTMCEINIKFYVFNRTAADVSKFLDDNFDDVANMARLAFLKLNYTYDIINDQSLNYKSTNLYKTYGHLMN
jgi:hypothetical protein